MIINQKAGVSRRSFLKGSMAGTATLLSMGHQSPLFPQSHANGETIENSVTTLDLSPARWLWYPSQRALPNTFILFRKSIDLHEKPVSAKGWILGDSRYLLSVNGERVQFGPAPSDPRWAEADPVDLSDYLQKGNNVIGSTVLYYGQGDGTWPTGKPGFIFYLDIEYKSGKREQVVSDTFWQCRLATSWPPGHYKRWYLRALQEEFDARLYPYGWINPNYNIDNNWLPAMELDCPANKPALCSTFSDYLGDSSGNREICELRARQIPHMRETKVPVTKLTESYIISWKRPPEEYFDCLPPDAFTATRNRHTREPGTGQWQVDLSVGSAVALTFELEEQIVGWPGFTIEAPAGTVVELLVHEAHQVGGPVLLNTHFNAWTRFICREGENNFETFDFESLRWLQLHIHNTEGNVTIKQVNVRRRQFPWVHEPEIACSDDNLQRLLNASVNTLHNSAQETVVDGMGRERQQYSGDGGHQLHAIYYHFGETRLPARFINTWSQGITKDGFFLDCWPAYDRLSRLSQRQLDLTPWGPLLDHGIGFVFDCFYYYQYTGDTKALTEVYPRLLRFVEYVYSITDENGLLPVENIGVPWVWLDTDAFEQQRHKQCAFNLYAIAMLKNALVPLCMAFGDDQLVPAINNWADDLLAKTQKRFWSPRYGTFINNLPWLQQGPGPMMDDRSLATALLYDLCVDNQYQRTLDLLASPPSNLKLCYPANACWRLWALSRFGKMDAVFHDFDTRWAGMDSVKLNNTLQESWKALPDSGAQWSHCPVAPLYVLYMNIAGIQPLAPAYSQYIIRPQLHKLTSLELTAQTVQGPIRFKATGGPGGRTLGLSIPPEGEGLLVVDEREKLSLKKSNMIVLKGLQAFVLPAGKSITIKLEYT